MRSASAPLALPEVGEVGQDESDFDLDCDWNVVLLDDDSHSYDYVIEMLGDIFGYDPLQAYCFAVEVDMKKRVRLWTGARERAEAFQERIHDYGADPRMEESEGSMSCILEPVY